MFRQSLAYHFIIYPHFSELLVLHLFGYLDPGTGTLLLQLLIASVVTVGVYFRNALGAAMAVITGRRLRAQEKNQDTEPE